MPSFLGLAYPYILLVNLAFLVFWIIMKKREFILSFLAILLGWNTLTRYIGLHPGSIFRKAHYEGLERGNRSQEGQIKVMSYNVRAFDLYRWTGTGSVRGEILGLFREADPDVLCIQEYYSPGRPSGPEAELEDFPYRHMEYSVSSRRSKYGIGIYSHGVVSWDETLPTGTSLAVKARWRNGGSWLACTNGGFCESVASSNSAGRTVDCPFQAAASTGACLARTALLTPQDSSAPTAHLASRSTWQRLQAFGMPSSTVRRGSGTRKL